MLNVLNMQLFRLKRSKMFWAMFIVCALLPLLSAILISFVINFLNDSFGGENVTIVLETYNISGGARTLTELGNLTSLISDPALFSLISASIFLSGEFSGGSIRNMVLANKSRTQIFLSFLCVALIIGFSYLGVSYVSTLICFGIATGFDGVTAAEIANGCVTSLLLGLLAIALVQAIVCFFLFITRKTSSTIIFPLLVVFLLPSIIESIVEVVFLVNLAEGHELSSAMLGWVPLYNASLFNGANIDGALVGKIVMYNAPLAALFSFFGWFALDKCDLK